MLVLLLLLVYIIDSAHGQSTDHTTCKDSGLDWYTSVVGETPCVTYQRLHRICDSTYQVPLMNANSSNPPDICSDQIPECCCNSVAFSLSMFCLNCQQGVGNGGTGTGFDAIPGTYQKYLTQNGKKGFCSPNTNRSLPAGIQTAVCSDKIKIFDDLIVRDMWADGSWFYKWASENITTDNNVKANNSFTRCNFTEDSTASSTGNISSPVSTQVGSTPPAQTVFQSSGGKVSIGALVGAVVGSAFLTGLTGTAVVFLMRRRRRGWRQGPQPEPFIVGPDREASTFVNSSSVTVSSPNGQVPPRKNAPAELRHNVSASTGPPAYEFVSKRRPN